MRRALFWRLISTFLLIIAVTSTLVAFYGYRVVRQAVLETQIEDMAVHAALIGRQVELNGPVTLERGDLFCKDVATFADARVTLIDLDGVVLGDSHERSAVMDNHANRPEVLTVMAYELGFSTRFSYTLQKEMLYVARRIPTLDIIVRMAIPLADFRSSLMGLLRHLFFGLAVIALVASWLGWRISRRITWSIESMVQAAERFAEGDFKHRVGPGETEELQRLADSMNSMATQLDDQIATIRRQHDEQEAVFSSMVEGVVAIDHSERILYLNPAAAALLEVEQEWAEGRTKQEVVRNVDVQSFLRRVLQSDTPQEGEVVLHQGGQKHLRVQGTALKDNEGAVLGGLMVMHDVTRVKKLEDMRREFVANVSHELKTPVTSIKGFVETLEEGAVENPDDARRFLGIIGRQSDRLTAIINDLLSLSRLEQDREEGRVELEPGSVRAVVEEAVHVCEAVALAKEIKVNVEGAEVLALMNAALLEQALVNLISNAIKYSAEKTSVHVAYEVFGSDVAIRVMDEGPGISPEHIPRLFERFYRIDKGRSREMGGTGLGLAIVKHIAQVQAGRVEVKSEVGEGSTFTVWLKGAGAS